MLKPEGTLQSCSLAVNFNALSASGDAKTVGHSSGSQSNEELGKPLWKLWWSQLQPRLASEGQG